jgi:hypothetical protein
MTNNQISILKENAAELFGDWLLVIGNLLVIVSWLLGIENEL